MTTSQPIRIAAELIGTVFVAVNLGKAHALVAVGSALVEEDDHGRWRVTASVLESDGYMAIRPLPDSFGTEEEAINLARSLNAPEAIVV